MHMHFSHFSLTTEMDSSLVPVSFRTLYEFDLNEAIDVYDYTDVYDFITHRNNSIITHRS